MRMTRCYISGFFLMAYIRYVCRPNGVEGTWAFFNLVFVQNLCILLLILTQLRLIKQV